MSAGGGFTTTLAAAVAWLLCFSCLLLLFVYFDIAFYWPFCGFVHLLWKWNRIVKRNR
jgi:hypothetical protein